MKPTGSSTTAIYTCDSCHKPIHPATDNYIRGNRVEDVLPSDPNDLRTRVKPGAKVVRYCQNNCEMGEGGRDLDPEVQYVWTIFTANDPRPWHTEAAGH